MAEIMTLHYGFPPYPDDPDLAAIHTVEDIFALCRRLESEGYTVVSLSYAERLAAMLPVGGPYCVTLEIVKKP